ncbi:hypothetical protein QZH41_019854 [Actinostola sp. cb2023]|nr:hypothetical protein QZH41_019854 [Actinostola sp. cb2023]
MSSKEPAAKIPKIDKEPSCYFSSPWHFSDVVLIVEGQKFHVHKSTLSMWSPVFEKMFTSNFVERKAKEIPLPGKRADEFDVLLRLIYKYSIKTEQKVCASNYEFLLKLADEYQMEKVKKLCIKFMRSEADGDEDFDNVLKFCQVADRFGLDEIKSQCIQDAHHLTLSSIRSDAHYADISPEIKVQIFAKRIEALEEYLEKFSSTCSTLVRDVYSVVSKKVREVECDNYGHHSYDLSSSAVPPEKEKFDFECYSCKRRLENKWPMKDILTKTLKAPLKKFRTLADQFEGFNVVTSPALSPASSSSIESVVFNFEQD